MASWVLVPCLDAPDGLRGEFNELAPARDKGSDGSIGDSAHASSSSDHNPDETGATPYEDADSRNEVHAIDVDVDLRRAGWSMARAVQVIVTRHRSGQDDRLQNVIYNRKIWSRSWGWTAREYTGSNPHDKHAHFSARYTTAQENDTRPWGLLEAAEQEEDDGMANMTQAQFNERMSAWWNEKMDSDQAKPGPELNNLRRAPWNLVTSGTDSMYARLARIEGYAKSAADTVAAQAAALQAYIAREDADDDRIAELAEALKESVDQLRAALDDPAGGDTTPA